MSHVATLHAPTRRRLAGPSLFVAPLLIVWLGLIFWLGATEAFVAPAAAPPLGLLTAVLAPVIAFVVAYEVSSAVRGFALTVDLRLLTATQAWRFGGFVFVALNIYGVLPGYFAWPAGLGDMTIAAAAPWMVARLARDPGFAASRKFVGWNVLGMLDLIVAVSLGAAVPLLFPNLAGAAPAGALPRLPLVLIPGFFVPGYLILHLTALAQARRTAVAPVAA